MNPRCGLAILLCEAVSLGRLNEYPSPVQMWVTAACYPAFQMLLVPASHAEANFAPASLPSWGSPLMLPHPDVFGNAGVGRKGHEGPALSVLRLLPHLWVLDVLFQPSHTLTSPSSLYFHNPLMLHGERRHPAVRSW